MKNRMILLAAALLISSGWGQQVIKSLEADIYPEYYYRGVMVEYIGVVQKGTFNTPVSFMVPAGTDSAFSIIQKAEQKNPDIQILTVQQRGNERWVSVTPTDTMFHFIVFYSPFTNTTGKRHFDFSIKSDTDFPHFHILVQEPIVAENLNLIEPDAQPEAFQDQHGITMHRFHYDHLKAGQVQGLTIEYTNPSGQVTMEKLQTMLGSGNTANTNTNGNQNPHASSTVPHRYKLPKWQPLAALALMALIVGFSYKRFPGVSASKPEKQPAPTTAPASEPAAKNFCPQCGNAIQPQDKFCSDCGHKL